MGLPDLVDDDVYLFKAAGARVRRYYSIRNESEIRRNSVSTVTVALLQCLNHQILFLDPQNNIKFGMHLTLLFPTRDTVTYFVMSDGS